MPHKICSPSSLSRIFACRGSVDEVRKFFASHPDETGGSVYSREGELYHEGISALTVGKPVPPETPGDMREHQERVLKQIKDIQRAFSQSFAPYVEYSVDPAVYLGCGETAGTLDLGLIGTYRETGQIEAVVIDHKYGAGIDVEVVENPQLVAYALGFRAAFPFIDIRVWRLVILQPRTKQGEPKEWVLSDDELTGYAEEYRKILADIHPDSPRTPSEDACRFCPAKTTCRTRLELAAEASRTALTLAAGPDGADLLESTPIGDIPAERLAKILDAIPAIRGVLKDLESEASDRILHRRNPPPGYELSQSAGGLAWKSDIEENTVRTLRGRKFKDSDIFKKTLRTPTQILATPGLSARKRENLKESLTFVRPGSTTLRKVPANETATFPAFETNGATHD